MYIKWLTFSSDLLSLYPAVHFLSMWLSGIIAIMNCKGDRASPWKIPLWIFVLAKLPPAVNFFDGFVHKVYDFMWYFVHFEAVYYQAMRNNIICLFVVNPYHSKIFPFGFALI